MSLVVVLAITLLWLQPPGVLLLGASCPATAQALESVSHALYPYRIVALLDQRRTGYFAGSFSPLTDNLRTESDSEWRPTVFALADTIPLIILDARTESPIVVEEAKMILGTPGRLKRTLFVVETDGQAPALLKNGWDATSPGVRVIHENELEAALKEWRKTRPRHV